MLAVPPQIELKPLTIGPIHVETPLFLAPMAGQTNHAFRSLCREIGDCGMVCTEFISSRALQYKGSRKKTFQMFDWRETESPFAVQLFGNDPQIMAEAAQLVVEHGADIVDINMGCWVPKVAKKGGAGAALLRDVCTATAVVQAVVEAVDVPVTVKIRNGWEPDNPTAVPFAINAEQAGVKMIAVHGRFATQGHSGEADWDYIRQVKEAVNIPVIGNGDVVDANSAVRMMTQTGCDGVMVGRAALGNPWIFKQIAHEIRTGEPLALPTPCERAEMAIKQAKRTLETSQKPTPSVIRELRGQLLKYVHGLHDATTIRNGVVSAESLADIEAAFAPLLNEG